MPQNVVQSSFAGGEVSPDIYARVDLAKYSVSGRTLKNCIVHAQGGVSNRAGLEFIQEIKDSARKARLIGFEAETDDTYILEFGHLYMRVYRNGARVIHSANGAGFSAGDVYEIATPWIEADLPLLKYEQSNDILTVTHASYAPRELSRFDHDDWRLTTIDFQPAVAAPANVVAVATVAYSDADPSTGGYVETDHTYKISAVSADTAEESLPSVASNTVQNDVEIKRLNFNIITWDAVADAAYYNVYKNHNGVYGFLGRTVDMSFKDDNIEPDFTNTPQQGTNPFDDVNKYPRVVSFHQQRRTFASTNLRPQNVFMTQTGNYKNMGVATPAKDDDAVTFGIAARSKQKVLHIVSILDMILFTPSTEWMVTGPQQGVITPSSILLKPQSYFGCSETVRPIVIGDRILFALAKGNIVRDIGYVFQQDKYQSDDLSVLSQHLFDFRTIAGWTYAQAPFSQVWTHFEDGGWVALTYMKEHEVWAWSPQETAGYVESSASVSEGGEDASYFIVRRFINGAWRRYIERMHSRKLKDVKDAFFVDSGLTLDTKITVESLTLEAEAIFTITAHGLQDDQEVEVSSIKGPNDEQIDGRFTVERIDANTFHLKSAETGDYVDTSTWTVFDFLCDVRILVDQIAGADHLEGCDVVVLADGNVVQGLRVVGGEVTLPNPAGRVSLGLPYVSDLETLDLASGQQVVQGTIKSIGNVQLNVKDSRGLAVGESFDNLFDHKPRETEGYFESAKLYTEIIEITPQMDWNLGGRVCVRQQYPLPMTILAIIPNVEFAG